MSAKRLLTIARNACSPSREIVAHHQRNAQGGMMGRGMMGGGMTGGSAMGSPMMFRMMFALMDDGDGEISLQEFQAAHERIFKAMDRNKDGQLTQEEMQAFMQGTRRAVP